MTTDKMRAEFEAWVKVRDLPTATVHFEKTWSYVDLRTAWAFEGWRDGRKAEREAICIQWEGADATIAEVERLRGELAEAKAELDELVNETIKRNGWGAE